MCFFFSQQGRENLNILVLECQITKSTKRGIDLHASSRDKTGSQIEVTKSKKRGIDLHASSRDKTGSQIEVLREERRPDTRGRRICLAHGGLIWIRDCACCRTCMYGIIVRTFLRIFRNCEEKFHHKKNRGKHLVKRATAKI